MQERKNSEAGNEKEVDYGRKSGQDNTSENVIENRPEKRVKNKGGNKTGEFIARKRKERGMTQKEMAELLGVTNKAVSKWETSQGMPDIGILPELGKALGVTVDEILMEVGTGENGGIDIETPEGKEHYEPEECLQYGTLAVVFPSDDPKWTLVLNKDCVVEAGGSRIEEGGTVTLCKVAMEKTAPIIMH